MGDVITLTGAKRNYLRNFIAGHQERIAQFRMWRTFAGQHPGKYRMRFVLIDNLLLDGKPCDSVGHMYLIEEFIYASEFETDYGTPVKSDSPKWGWNVIGRSALWIAPTEE